MQTPEANKHYFDKETHKAYLHFIECHTYIYGFVPFLLAEGDQP